MRGVENIPAPFPAVPKPAISAHVTRARAMRLRPLGPSSQATRAIAKWEVLTRNQKPGWPAASSCPPGPQLRRAGPGWLPFADFTERGRLVHHARLSPVRVANGVVPAVPRPALARLDRAHAVPVEFAAAWTVVHSPPSLGVPGARRSADGHATSAITPPAAGTVGHGKGHARWCWSEMDTAAWHAALPVLGSRSTT